MGPLTRSLFSRTWWDLKVWRCIIIPEVFISRKKNGALSGKKTSIPFHERLLGEEWDFLNLHDYVNLGNLHKIFSKFLTWTCNKTLNIPPIDYISRFPNHDAAACQICFSYCETLWLKINTDTKRSKTCILRWCLLKISTNTSPVENKKHHHFFPAPGFPKHPKQTILFFFRFSLHQSWWFRKPIWRKPTSLAPFESKPEGVKFKSESFGNLFEL